MFSIDDRAWPYPCSIERTAEIRASDISGLLLDRSYFNDVLGTYMVYTVSIAVPLNDRDSYSAIYELLTQPVDGHRFVLPYNQGTVQVTGRVDSVGDMFVRLSNDGKYWRSIRFTTTANHPTKAVTLSGAISRGRAPVPEVSSPTEGTSYTWNGTYWVPSVVYADADVIAY